MNNNKSENSVFVNRELSWLKFNLRVLEESLDKNVPLLERMRFISIFTSNLDEFFMIRVGSLFDQSLLGTKKRRDNKTNLTPKQQLSLIFEKTREILLAKDEAYSIAEKQLRKKGVIRLIPSETTDQEYAFLSLYFKKEVLPLISPQVIAKRHRFPFLHSGQPYVAVRFASKSSSPKIAIVPAQGAFRSIVFLPTTSDKLKYVFVSDLIMTFAEMIFAEEKIIERTIFKVTRNADINIQEALFDQEFDYRDAMERLLQKRKKLAPVRLELSEEISDSLRTYLCGSLDISKRQAYTEKSPFDYSFLGILEEKIRSRMDSSGFFFTAMPPQKHPDLDDNLSITSQVRKKDLLLSYPYHSIKPFIKLLREAGADENVVSIKITLYRVAKESEIVDALIAASENGKEVVVILELRARFDEENNIDWSKRLEESSCTIMYGLDEYKVHSKLMLITRKRNPDEKIVSGQIPQNNQNLNIPPADSAIEYITQIGTGNYNEKTARLYTDVCLITANQTIGADAAAIFMNLQQNKPIQNPALLLAAPLAFKERILQMIDDEILKARNGVKAEINLKMNSLSDKDIINKLLEASMSGVKIRMIVRGICCMKAGVENLTESIEIKSIVGRLLEHSRIFFFGSGENMRVFISSADFMTRNTERRVEVAAPILDPYLKKNLADMFDILWNDNVKARIQLPDGSYIKPSPADGEEARDAQTILFHKAYERVEHPIESAGVQADSATVYSSHTNTNTNTNTHMSGHTGRAGIPVKVRVIRRKGNRRKGRNPNRNIKKITR